MRVVLLDEADNVLLVRFRDGMRSWWCAPGGGLEPGESHEAAARRELREELGLEAFDLGPWIWTRRHAGTFRGRDFDQAERWFLGRATAFAPAPSAMMDVEHGEGDMRWWSVDELVAKTGESFTPRRFPALLRALLIEGPPTHPIDVGV